MEKSQKLLTIDQLISMLEFLVNSLIKGTNQEPASGRILMKRLSRMLYEHIEISNLTEEAELVVCQIYKGLYINNYLPFGSILLQDLSEMSDDSKIFIL